MQLLTSWSGRRVLAMTDCLWGALDGVNDAGLAVSLAFGGRKVVGDGFGIPLILRYVLEVSETTAEACATLARIPSHMSYNLSVLDGLGHYATVHVAPDRPSVVLHRRVATNHQRPDDWPKHAIATASVEREEYLRECLRDSAESQERFVARFLEPPLFSRKFDQGWGTLYTSIYSPDSGEMVLRWPHATLQQSFESFQEIALDIEYRST